MTLDPDTRVPPALTAGTAGFLFSHLANPPPAHFHQSVRAFEARAELAGSSPWTLMRRAATATWRLLQQRWPEAQSLTVLAGGGNNGGDGRVLAALAAQDGWTVKLVECGDSARLPADSAAARARAWAAEMAAAGKIEVRAAGDWRGAEDDSDLCADALLGTGLKGAVRPEQRAVLEQLRLVRHPVVALDIPSGLAADTGAALGPVPKAAATVTFIAPKPGLFTGAGREHCGAIHLAGLEVDTQAPPVRDSDADSGCALLCSGSLRPSLPPVAAHAHKGQLGHLLVAGGDAGMGGAVLLAAEAALRSGAGLVSAALDASALPALLARCPEVMARAPVNGQDLQPMLAAAQVVVLGPGLGTGARAQQFVQRTLMRSGDGPCGLVVDAGALRLLAERPDWRAQLPPDTVLTPHPGEAAAWLGCTSEDVQGDRFAAVRELSAATGAVVALKGSGTLVAASGRLLGLCPSGNSGMATAGSGDVLAGLVGALLARGMEPAPATTLAVAIHAEAGDRAANLLGQSGLTASRLLAQVPELIDAV